MPRPRNLIPKFSVDRTGRAFCKVKGQFISLGRGDSQDARLRYAEVLQKLSQGLPVAPGSERPDATGLSVSEICLAFMLHAQTEYVDAVTGKPSKEYDCYKFAVKPLRELFGSIPAESFGPNSLRVVRERYISNGWTRSFIGKTVSRIRHIWRWAVSREMISATSLEALRSLEPLKRGKSAAVESKRRYAVPQADIDAVRKRLRQRNRDILDLLLLCGSRPSELFAITPSMIDQGGDIWTVKLQKHKNSHRGHLRTLYFGKNAQAILTRYLEQAKPEGKLFPGRPDTFRECIRCACIRGKITPFVPYHLRHTALTHVRDELGIEAAQAIGGHAKPDMTAHYAAKMDRLAKEAAKKARLSGGINT